MRNCSLTLVCLLFSTLSVFSFQGIGRLSVLNGPLSHNKIKPDLAQNTLSFKQEIQRPKLTTAHGNPSDVVLSVTDSIFDVDFVDDIAKAKASILESLGLDAFIFLLTCVTVVPICGLLGVSPILGFLAMGVVLGPSGLEYLRDLKDFSFFGELGILFLLFEQGLELSTSRLKALSKYAFGLGLQQVLFCTLAFGLIPFLGGVTFFEKVLNAPESIVGITRIDEAFVIGVALALSSSAFVLKTLQEKGEMGSKFAKACLGVLLFQDVAIVPVLVLLPILETEQINLNEIGPQLTLLATGILKSLAGLGAILLAGKYLFSKFFSFVASAQNNETFTSLVLLVAIGTGLATEEIGLSSTLGAFAAGVLLAETSYSTQIENDIKPFRGVFLALFFLNTGASIDPSFLGEYYPTVLALTFGLIAVKTAVVSAVGPFWGLTVPESVKTGFILAGGGEFAFVVLKLAEKLQVLPETLNRILVGVVVISMALTPALYSAGKFSEKYLEENFFNDAPKELEMTFEGEDQPIILVGFGTVGQVIATFFVSPTVSSELKADIVAFDLDPANVMNGRARGYNVEYGDGSQPTFLRTAGIDNPKAIVVTYDDAAETLNAVERLRGTYPETPIFALGQDFVHYWKLKKAGATRVASTVGEMSMGLGSQVLEEFGLANDNARAVKRTLRSALADLGKDGTVDSSFNSSMVKTLQAAERNPVAAVEGDSKK